MECRGRGSAAAVWGGYWCCRPLDYAACGTVDNSVDGYIIDLRVRGTSILRYE
jgi:hypothetical protein